MTESGKKWLIGCGVAGFLMVLILAAFAWGGVMLFRKAAEGIEDLEATSREVSQRFGRAADFTPAPTGEIPADRIEAFLATREIMAPYREELASSLATLDGSEDGGLTGKLGGGPGCCRGFSGSTANETRPVLKQAWDRVNTATSTSWLFTVTLRSR